MKTREMWVWMPHPGHLIVGQDCRFHLCTFVGGWLVSTVGEYLPDAPVREILASSRGIQLQGRGDERLADYMKRLGFEDIGAGRKYETMVFPAKKSDTPCCLYTYSEPQEVDFNGYNDAKSAYEGHLAMCEKWTFRKP